ncbi:MAG: hypothetical protein CFE23_09260 [Flavobacterium sp. BFFFF1]|nr:MAG: hypothetical protein CFE23_09260 [Flavobacterium sp. BFFFF1]
MYSFLLFKFTNAFAFITLGLYCNINQTNMKKETYEHRGPSSQTLFGIVRRMAYLALLVSMISCSVQNQIDKSDFKRMPEHFSVSFYDKLDTLDYHYNNRIYTRSFVKDFVGLENIDFSKPIRATMNDNELFLDFEDTDKKQHVLKFYGQRRRNRFVFYTSYETVSFPVLFIKKDMTKFTVYLPNNNEILFQKHEVGEGMFLFFGGGSASKSDYKFKLLRDE